MDREIRWFEMPVSMQISNVGSEVARAIRYKNKNDDQKAANFCKKAIEFLRAIEKDPKNKNHIGEFDFCIEELEDYFLGNNEYNTTDEMLTRYYDAFI